MARPVRVCGIAGSLRRGSYNRALLRAAVELAPDALEIAVFDRLGDVPLYNADVEAEGDPEPVVALKTAIRQADALPPPLSGAGRGDRDEQKKDDHS